MSTPKKLTDLTALGAAPANTDLLEIVDISDTTDNAAGSSKKVTVSELLTNAGGGIEFSTAISGLGSETGQVADADTLLAALAKINDRLPLSAGSSYPVTGDLYLTAELMIGGLTDPDTFLHIRSNPVANYGHATFEGIAGDDCYISFQDSSAGLTSHVGTDYNADSSGAHDTILANLDGGSIKFRTGSDNLQSGLNTQAEITTGGDFLLKDTGETWIQFSGVNANSNAHGVKFGIDGNSHMRLYSQAWWSGQFTDGSLVMTDNTPTIKYAFDQTTSSIGFAIYGAHTDASNYERLSFTQDGAGTCAIAAETLGTGTDDVDIHLKPAGDGRVILTDYSPSPSVNLQVGLVSGYIPVLYFGDSGTQGAYFQGDSNQSKLDLYFGNVRSSHIEWRTEVMRPASADDNQIDLGGGGSGTAGGYRWRSGFFGTSVVVGDYTDASNYEHLSLTHAAGTCTIAALTLGTGTDNVDIDITPAGTGIIGANSHIDLATSKYLRAASDPTNRYIDPASIWVSNLGMEIRSTASFVTLRGGSAANASWRVDDDAFLGAIWGTGDKTYTIGAIDQDAVASRGIFNLTIQAGSANASPGAGASIYGGDLTLNAGNGASGEAGAAHGGDINLTAGTGYGTGNDGNIIMASLPTSDPTVAGALWNDSGTLKVSAG